METKAKLVLEEMLEKKEVFTLEKEENEKRSWIMHDSFWTCVLEPTRWLFLSIISMMKHERSMSSYTYGSMSVSMWRKEEEICIRRILFLFRTSVVNDRIVLLSLGFVWLYLFSNFLTRSLLCSSVHRPVFVVVHEITNVHFSSSLSDDYKQLNNESTKEKKRF